MSFKINNKIIIQTLGLTDKIQGGAVFKSPEMWMKTMENTIESYGLKFFTGLIEEDDMFKEMFRAMIMRYYFLACYYNNEGQEDLNLKKDPRVVQIEQAIYLHSTRGINRMVTPILQGPSYEENGTIGYSDGYQTKMLPEFSIYSSINGEFTPVKREFTKALNANIPEHFKKEFAEMGKQPTDHELVCNTDLDKLPPYQPGVYNQVVALDKVNDIEQLIQSVQNETKEEDDPVVQIAPKIELEKTPPSNCSSIEEKSNGPFNLNEEQLNMVAERVVSSIRNMESSQIQNMSEFLITEAKTKVKELIGEGSKKMSEDEEKAEEILKVVPDTNIEEQKEIMKKLEDNFEPEFSVSKKGKVVPVSQAKPPVNPVYASLVEKLKKSAPASVPIVQEIEYESEYEDEEMIFESKPCTSVCYKFIKGYANFMSEARDIFNHRSDERNRPHGWLISFENRSMTDFMNAFFPNLKKNSFKRFDETYTSLMMPNLTSGYLFAYKGDTDHFDFFDYSLWDVFAFNGIPKTTQFLNSVTLVEAVATFLPYPLKTQLKKRFEIDYKQHMQKVNIRK